MAGESARARARKARTQAERLNAAADRWERGAEGELRTAEALAHLGPAWVIWHDVAWPGRRYANIDHVVVGPSGVFVIDSKNWSGSITTRDGVLRQNGYLREKEVAKCAEAAIAIGSLIPDAMTVCRPVMCFAHPQNVDPQVRDVTMCSTEDLVSTITAGPEVLDPNQARSIVDQLQNQIRMRTADSTAAHRAPASRASRAPARPRPARRRRSLARRAARGVLYVMLLMFALGVVTNAVEGAIDPTQTPLPAVGTTAPETEPQND